MIVVTSQSRLLKIDHDHGTLPGGGMADAGV